MSSIRKRGNSYQITVNNGRDITGRQIIETATFTPDPARTEEQNQKALEKFAFEFEEKVKSGKYLDGEKMLHKDFVALRIKNYAEKQLQKTSIERCESSLNNLILPEPGHLKLAKIQPLHIQTFYNKLMEQGYIINGHHKQYKSNTIKRIHQIISSTLNTAVRWQLIETNPCCRIKPQKPDRDTSDIRHFTLEEAQIFLDQLNKEYTGFRLGELIALTWEDIDFKGNAVSISKSTAKTKEGMITKPPKTKSSIRIVSLPAETMNLLKRWKTEQQTYRLSAGTYRKGIGHIFIQDNGSQMDISTPNHVFKKIIKCYNESAEEADQLPEITLHGLRHTSATLLIAQNIDIRTVSGRLGHAECSTTMNIYAHALKKQDELAAVSIGGLFAKKA